MTGFDSTAQRCRHAFTGLVVPHDVDALIPAGRGNGRMGCHDGHLAIDAGTWQKSLCRLTQTFHSIRI